MQEVDSLVSLGFGDLFRNRLTRTQLDTEWMDWGKEKG